MFDAIPPEHGAIPFAYEFQSFRFLLIILYASGCPGFAFATLYIEHHNHKYLYTSIWKRIRMHNFPSARDPYVTCICVSNWAEFHSG